MSLRFLGQHIDRRTPAVASFTRKVSIIDDLKANMLVGMDSMGPEGFDIINSKGYVNINSCRVRIPMKTRNRSRSIKVKVFATQYTIIPPRSTTYIPVKHHLHTDNAQDLMFDPALAQFSAYALLTDIHLAHIIVENGTNKPMIVPNKTFVGHLCSLDPRCRLHSVEDDDEATFAAFHGSSTSPQPKTMPTEDFATHDSTGTNTFSKMSSANRDKLPHFLDENADIFEDKGWASAPQDEWLKVRLRQNWQDMIPKKCRVYPMTSKDAEVIDKTLAKLQAAKKLGRTTQSVPFSFPVFVVWRTMPDSTRKGRMVIDVRGLNRMSIPDAYPIKNQDQILFRITSAKYVTILNATAFFYQ